MEQKCPKCGANMEQGRTEFTRDDKPIYNFRCPKCDHTERISGNDPTKDK